MAHEWILAIDFGTSYTVAAARRDGRPAEVIEIDGERRVPSVVLVDEHQGIVVGRAAESLASTFPDRVLRTPKYRLGVPTAVVIGGRPHRITDLVGAILSSAQRAAVLNVGSVPREVRLTFPASWSAPRREELLASASAAGLAPVVLVPEPVAAATAFAEDELVPPGAHVLVYDLGGGTFDTAVLRAEPEGFSIVGRPIGDVNLGGELFDELVANHLGGQLDPSVWEHLQVSDESVWQLAAMGLRSEARRVKEVLSTHPMVDAVIGLPSGIVNVRITRGEFEELIRPYVAESIDVTTRAATDAGLRVDDVHAVYLVGGASRSPFVGEQVQAAFPRAKLSRRGDPKAAVALGATHPGLRSGALGTVRTASAEASHPLAPPPPPTPASATVRAPFPPATVLAVPPAPADAAFSSVASRGDRGRGRTVGVVGAALAVVAAIGLAVALSRSGKNGSDPASKTPVSTTTAALSTTTAPVAVVPSVTNTPPASVPATLPATTPPIAGPGACPTGIELDEAIRRVGPDFAVAANRPASSARVLQLVVATADDEVVVSLCRDSRGDLWYFSHGTKFPLRGVFAPAQATTDGVSAPYPPATTPTYFVTAAGLRLASGQQLALRARVCLGANDLPSGLSAAYKDSPACVTSGRRWDP